MATQQLTVVQQKAISLREELFAKQKQFEAAMPKWMDAERLLRIVFTTALKNPRILDCTRESIFGAIMQAAQLGTEPVLGRAYLIPYNNNKQIGGRWQKVLECQFQLGYQGLIDLARRTGTISDVYGFNVYENDEFDIKYGTEREIIHRPWYLDREKRKSGASGEIFGAYCVWVLKDGTKHPEFMFIDDIHKRRDRSQAYQNAIKYKNEDSPWLVWPEDMNLKTVLKHSSKMVPASIEFMKAVSFDNETDMGQTGGGFNPFLSGALGGGPADLTEPPQPPDMGEEFSKLIQAENLSKEHVDKFISACTEEYGRAESEIMDDALGDPQAFTKAFKEWEATNYPPKGEGGSTPPQEEQKTLKDDIGGLKKTGLKAWEEKHRGEIDGLSPEDKDFFFDKWRRVMGAGYRAEGQPGYKPRASAPPPQDSTGQAEPPQTEEEPPPQNEGQIGSNLFQGMDDGEDEDDPKLKEKEQQNRMKAAFQSAMLQYKEQLGEAKFLQVLRKGKYAEINDVPPDEFDLVLQDMDAALTEQ